MRRFVPAMRTATTIRPSTVEFDSARASQSGPAVIYNGATGNIFVSENSGERAKSPSTLVSELSSYEAAAAPAASPYSIGAWFYPGWSSNTGFGFWQPDPWSFIRPYPERMPLMGEYTNNAQAACDHHIAVAQAYGIDWFGVVWFCEGVQGSNSVSIPAGELAGLTTMLSSSRAGASFKVCALWDSQTTNAINLDNGVAASSARFLARFDAACAALAGYIQANTTKWLQRDGKYVVALRLEHWANAFVPVSGLTLAQLITRMRTQMAAASAAVSTAGLHIAAWVTPSGFWVRTTAQAAGCDSVTSYGYFAAIVDKDGTPSVGPTPTSYAALSEVFRAENAWHLQASSNASNTIKVIVPLCGGWDERPWNGTRIGRPTPAEFAAHLQQQKALLDADLAGPNRAGGWAVVCTWNEHGEGSAVMPTVPDEYAVVQQIRSVLKP